MSLPHVACYEGQGKEALAPAARHAILRLFMTPVTLPLKRMSKADKLRAMEALWNDLSLDDDKLPSPPWHADVLLKTERLVAAGEARFSDWEEAKSRIRRKASKF